MGKEWYWGGRSSKRSGATDHRDTTTSSAGCMSAVFQFFDFHQFQFPNLHHQQSSFNPTTSLPLENPTSPKGVEAPRNSLKSEGSSLSSIIEEEEESLNIPMGIQIKTNGGTGSTKGVANSNDICSESSSSPGAKTPNLVARLMGLELLPENSQSPSFHATPPNPLSKSHLHSLRPRHQPLQSKSRHFMDSDTSITGTRSLPETPRISSARRSDVEYHHRLSLQINKENVSVSEDLDLSRLSSLRRKDLKIEDECRSPGHYARQIVKQVKESVSRRAGFDITNTVRNRDQYRRDDKLVNQLKKSKKASKGFAKIVDDGSPGKHSTPSCSPRLRFMESKSNYKASSATALSSSTSKEQTFHQASKSVSTFSKASAVAAHTQTVKVYSKPNTQPLQEQQVVDQKQQKNQLVSNQKYSKKIKSAREGFGNPPKLKKQEESFVRPSTATSRTNIPDKNCKKTPLTNNLLNLNNVPTLLIPVKKSPSPPATKIPHKQLQPQVPEAQQSKRRSPQLSRSRSQTYEQEATHALNFRGNNSGGDISNGGFSTTTTNGVGGAELYHYITKILCRTGINKDTPVSFTKWFSPSHPLDPSIFYHLEQYSNSPTNINHFTQLHLQCNRMLLFHLVDEILVQILKPHMNMKPWVSSTWTTRSSDHRSCMEGSQLIDALCMRIQSFPCADCQVLEDIDALIDKDLPQLKVQNATAFEEEGEGVVSEVEKDIVDTLVHETALGHMSHSRDEMLFVGGQVGPCNGLGFVKGV
ncbi:hypothetical protein FNV43_RR24169 [Rhamnella rubrinervis]|uniref:DUF3741 domain-containing protein n=1 Tax=Rhamnella rubrinervis TaxID=2594499 RepID=A0A8K0DL00_9ROSA|nr:hypothetical protein FNV43_RR24169 [Rhamnella rubrinervis]